MSKILEVSDLEKQFGSFVAINDLSFSVDDSDLIGLIGPNGAGKTTLFNLITGELSPTSGRIYFDGTDVTDAPVAERVLAGIGRSFQISNVFPELTVEKNIRAPIIARHDSKRNFYGSVESEKAVLEETEEYLELVDLKRLAQRKAKDLSFGQQRRVEIGIGLATDPDLMLLDEPTAGMNPSKTTETVKLINEINRETDTTFIITEHDMEVIFSLATKVLVLHNGSKLAYGDPEGIRGNQEVKSSYLGMKES